MDSPLRLARCAALVLSALVFTGCATPLRVNSYTERGMDLAKYRTYNWSPADTLATGDPRLDNNPFFHGRVQGDVEKQLSAKGFEKATSSTPDLLIHYHASINQRIDASAIDRKNGQCNADTCQPYVYDAGTLLLDFVDARTNKIVWHGWAEGSMDGVIDNQDWMDQKIDDAVTRIFEKFPRRL